MPLQATSGAASYDSFGGGVAAVPNYIEDVFSVWNYTGNGSTQTITNGIDLSTYGGLVWSKSRSVAGNHELTDTVRGAGKRLSSDNDGAQNNFGDVSGFLTNGYTLSNVSGNINGSGKTEVSWTFREKAKFFDIVTWTGNGTNGRTISHNLGADPGFVLIKQTSAAEHWWAWHRSTSPSFGLLEGTDAFGTNIAGVPNYNIFGNGSSFVAPSSTALTVTSSKSNASGQTYVAYLFAHDAGGFGLTGTDNVISCGSYTGNGAALGPAVNLGYEPQWILVKRATGGTGNWYMVDNMRGFVTNSQDTYATAYLFANRSDSELTTRLFNVTSTGFQPADSDPAWNNSGDTYIYIAIRRGPMKVPTSGTSVFAVSSGANGTSPAYTSNFPIDMYIQKGKTTGSAGYTTDRLRGADAYVETSSTIAETTGTFMGMDSNVGLTNLNSANRTGRIGWMFQRAPSFFDEVCYTGTGSVTTQAHNLGVVPELMITFRRSNGSDWISYSAATGNTKYLSLNLTSAATTFQYMWNNTSPTISNFTVGISGQVNASGSTYVAYLFATCAGVSKVGSYTGTGTTLQVDCGFTGGARFVLIKKTSGTGSWYVWDSARGIVSGNDPYLLLNSTAAEVTSTDYIDAYSAGFEISSTAPSEINENGGSFIFLAIS